MRGISKLAALLSALVLSLLVGSPAWAVTPVAAKKPKVQVLTEGQKQILKKKAIKVRAKGLDEGKLKLKAKSSTFDQQKPRKLARPAVLRPQRPVAKLKLTSAGRKAAKSCEARDVQITGKGVKLKFELERDTAKCKPKPIDLANADSCDIIGQQDGSLCMLPFPNDFYTVKDKKTVTGRRIDFTDEAMPQNASGVPIAAAPYNLNDGFSPGQAIVVRVPGLDNPDALEATDPIQLNELSRNDAAAKNEPIVVIDTTTGKRHPIWVEIDSNAGTPEAPAPQDTAVLIHPAVNFEHGHRYVVAMRNLKTAEGKTIEAPEGFRYYRDKLPSKKQAIKSQSKRFENVFRSLRKAKVKRSDLYLAWDFTVASAENISGRMLSIRDDAFGQLGDSNLADLQVQGSAPSYSVDTVTEYAPCGGDGCQDGEDAELQRRIDGTFTVPCYLQPDCGPGGRFALDANGMPTRNGTYTANFRCIVPRETLDTAGAAAGNRPQVYGHGLLGSANETSSGPQQSLAQTHKFVICGTDEIGFSANDVPNTIGLLGNLADFPELTDRVQQGLLNELFLGRLMIHPQGFSGNAAFHVDPADLGSPAVINTERLYYNGNSQGGILGGALTAVAPDFTRASLGVPGMNYSVLLNRSIDFDVYKTVLDPAYPNPMTQQLALSLIQMLWDRSESNGYAHRMTDDPLPNTPAHEVLLNVAFGDHQVTTWQADVEARTVGARIHTPIVYEGRWPGVDVGWGIEPIQSYPYTGSAIVYWDSGPVRPPETGTGGDNGVVGTDPPPVQNVPNESGDDPHGLPRQAAAEQQMVSDFLRPEPLSSITDTCLGGPCYAGGFTGP